MPNVEAVLDRRQLPPAQLRIDVAEKLLDRAAAVGRENTNPNLLSEHPPQQVLGGESLHLCRVLHLQNTNNQN